jgi:hypothetical protein
MSTCPPGVVSRCIGGGAPWRSITAARCSAAAHRCSSWDARTGSSTTRSRAGCLMPPRPILSLRAVSSPHLYRVVALWLRCPRQELDNDVSRSASASSLSDTACGPSSLQLPSPTPRRHHALARLCVPRGRINSPPCPAHLIANGVWTNILRIASTQGRCHCDVAAVPCCTCEHAHSAAMPSHHLPLSLLAQPRVAPTQCAAIKGTSPVHFVRASDFTVRWFRSTRSPRSSSQRHGRLLRPPQNNSWRCG